MKADAMRLKASGGWRDSSGLGIANPNSKSIPLGGGWRLFTGLRVVTTQPAHGASPWASSRTFGIGKNPVIDRRRGNVVLEKGRAFQLWRTETHYPANEGWATTTNPQRGTAVTAGSKTRTEQHFPRPTTVASAPIMPKGQARTVLAPYPGGE